MFVVVGGVDSEGVHEMHVHTHVHLHRSYFLLLSVKSNKGKKMLLCLK